MPQKHKHAPGIIIAIPISIDRMEDPDISSPPDSIGPLEMSDAVFMKLVVMYTTPEIISAMDAKAVKTLTQIVREPTDALARRSLMA